MASNKNNTDEKTTVVENLDSHLTNAGMKVAKNKKMIFICVGIAAIVAAFVLSYLFIYRNPRLQDSWGAYNKVLLQKVKGEASDSVAAQEFQKVSTNFSSMPAGNVSALSAAQAYYDVKNYAAAIKLLEKLDLSDPVLQSQSKALLADCYVNTDKFDQAISAFDQAIQIADGNPSLVPVYLMKEATIYDHLKKYDKAIACYEEIQSKYPKYQIANGRTIESYIEQEKAMAGK